MIVKAISDGLPDNVEGTPSVVPTRVLVLHLDPVACFLWPYCRGVSDALA